jgi:hypothetical protein
MTHLPRHRGGGNHLCDIQLEVRRVYHSAWELFRQYHYLNQSFHKSARAFVAFLNDGTPVAFQAVIASPHPNQKGIYRGHRAVCLPDYQGVGIGWVYYGVGLLARDEGAQP